MDRREFVRGSVLGAAALAAGCYPVGAPPRERRAYLGTYTVDTGSEGIYHLLFDTGTGALRIEGVTRGVRNPSFLALHPDGRSLYAVEEVDDMGAERSGGVASFAVEGPGALRETGRALSGGAHPAHVSVDAGRGRVLVANYSGGTVTVLGIDRGGALAGPPQVLRHERVGPARPRQEAPHPHSAYSVGPRVYVPDLGLDRIVAYGWEGADARLAPLPAASTSLRPGDGPRHMAFHPRLPVAYVINELSSTITSLALDPGTGPMRATGTVSTLPAGFTGESFCADIHVHPNGRFLYGSNRGHDSIVVAAIDPSTGEPTPIQHHPTGGSWPRNFALSPDGRFLLVENQRSGDVVTLAIDPASGRLSATGQVLKVPAPVCLVFAA